MKITFLDAFTCNSGDLSWSALEALGELKLYDRSSSSEVLARVKGASIIITNKCIIDESVLSVAENVKLICVAATGYNNIALNACHKRNIIVANVANYSTLSVVQQVFASLLSFLNNPQYYSRGVKMNRWSKNTDFAYTDAPIRNISSMTFGILGYGTIGKAVARTAMSLGANVIAYRRTLTSPDTPGVQMVDLETLLKNSDVLSLHLSGSPASRHLINASNLSKMKSNAILINTARGMVINENELYDWLSQNNCAQALLDVMDQEPPQKDHPLYSLANCLITPHQAWIGQGSRKKLIEGIVSNIIDFQKGELISL